MQITNDLKNYSKHMRGVKIVAVYGGSSIMGQIKDIRNGAHIIAATPGRLIDLLDRKAVSYTHLDVYKRQAIYSSVFSSIYFKCLSIFFGL